MKYKNGDAYICTNEPYKSKMIIFVNEEYNHENEEVIDEEMSIVSWQVHDIEAFDKKVCESKKVKTIKELLESGRNTYPFAFGGDMTYKSFKSYLKRNNMTKLEEKE